MRPLAGERAAPLLARMAGVLYWTGRYLERAEDTARIASVHGETHIDLPVGEDVGWLPLLDIAGTAGLFAERHPQLDVRAQTARWPAMPTEDDITAFVLFDRSNPSSVTSSIENLRDNLRQARPAVPREVWELCNELWRSSKAGAAQVKGRDERVGWLRTVVDECHRINGVLQGMMRRDEALTFLRVGQQLERASMTCRVLAARANSVVAAPGSDPYVDAHHRAVLRSLASYQPFRRATPSGHASAGTPVEFLVRDQHLPRSVSACLAELRDLVKALPENEEPLARCSDASVAVTEMPTAGVGPAGLRSFLLMLERAIGGVHDALTAAYFISASSHGARRGPAFHVRRQLPGRFADRAEAPARIDTIHQDVRPAPALTTWRVVHTTRYEYDAPVEYSYNEAHLRPRNGSGQRCLSHVLEVTPEPVSRLDNVDPFGNDVTIFSVRGRFDLLSVEATSEVTTSTPLPPPVGPPWESVRITLERDRTPAGRDARRFRAASRLVPVAKLFADYAEQSFTPSRPLIEATSDLASRIHREFVYEPGVTSVSTPLVEFFEEKRGVCQDFAHLMISCARSVGLAARYVSGYIPTASAPTGSNLTGSDASHAWVSVYLPGSGWVDLDPTNDQFADGTYVTTARGRDYWDVSPLRGSVEGGGASHRLHVSVLVEPAPSPGSRQD